MSEDEELCEECGLGFDCVCATEPDEVELPPEEEENAQS